MIYVGDSKPGDSLCIYSLYFKLCTFPFIALFLSTISSVLSTSVGSLHNRSNKVWQKYTL